MSNDHLRINQPADGVRVITLNRPAMRNAMHTAMQRELDVLLRDCEHDESVRAVVLTGAGNEAFSAGYDIKELGGFDVDAMLKNYEERRELVWNVAAFPKPLIGALQGAVHGAGAILAVAFDIRVGSPLTNFRFTAGMYNGVNNSWHLPKVVGLAKALEYTTTARRVSGAEALAAGLLNHVVEPEQVMDKAIEIATQIAAHPPAGIQWHKALMQANVSRSLAEGYAAENAVMANELRPRPPGEIFSTFLADHPKKN